MLLIDFYFMPFRNYSKFEYRVYEGFSKTKFRNFIISEYELWSYSVHAASCAKFVCCKAHTCTDSYANDV